MMTDNKLQYLLIELKAKVKQSSGKLREDKLIEMINLIARTEIKLKQNGNSCPEEIEREIMKYLRN